MSTSQSISPNLLLRGRKKLLEHTLYVNSVSNTSLASVVETEGLNETEDID